VRCATRCQDVATAGTARSDRCFDSNASRTRGGRRLCWWRRWLAQNELCRKRRNGQCRWARARISARSRNQSRDPFACNEKSLKVSDLIQAISLAAGNVHRYVGREADPSSPGVSRPVIRFLWSLLAPGLPPPSNWSKGSLTSSVARRVPQPLPRGGDLVDTGARTRPRASVGVARLVGSAAWGRVAERAVRGASNAPPWAVSGTPPARAGPQHPAPPHPRTRTRGRSAGCHPRLVGAPPGPPSAVRRGAPWAAVARSCSACARFSCRVLSAAGDGI